MATDFYYPTSKNAIQKTLAVQLASTATTGDPITFSDVDGVQNKPGVLVINRINAAGADTASSREFISYSGTSGNTVLIETRNVDGSASAKTHVVSSIVEFIADAVWAQRMIDQFKVEHSADGTHGATILKTTGSQTITGAKSFDIAPKMTFGTEAAGDVFYGDTDGTLIRLPKGTDGQVLTLASGVPAWVTGASSTQPSFRATRGGTNQSFSASTYVKIQHATEDWDTTTAYDNATNYRFTPLTAGKYLVQAQVRLTTLSAGKFLYSTIYKNGSIEKQNEFIAAGTGTQSVLCSTTVDMNGTTDYLEHFVWSDNGTTIISGDITETYFTATKL